MRAAWGWIWSRWIFGRLTVSVLICSQSKCVCNRCWNFCWGIGIDWIIWIYLLYCCISRSIPLHLDWTSTVSSSPLLSPTVECVDWWNTSKPPGILIIYPLIIPHARLIFSFGRTRRSRWFLIVAAVCRLFYGIVHIYDWTVNLTLIRK